MLSDVVQDKFDRRPAIQAEHPETPALILPIRSQRDKVKVMRSHTEQRLNLQDRSAAGYPASAAMATTTPLECREGRPKCNLLRCSSLLQPLQQRVVHP